MADNLNPETKLFILEQFTKMQAQTNAAIKDVLKHEMEPLIDKCSDEAAKRTIKQYCFLIGVDSDDAKQMDDHRQDMAHLRSSRKGSEDTWTRVKRAAINAIVPAAVIGAWEAFKITRGGGP